MIKVLKDLVSTEPLFWLIAVPSTVPSMVEGEKGSLGSFFFRGSHSLG